MNIALMRKLDYWAGIPLCFVLTLFHKARKIFRPGKPLCKTDKILFIKLFGLGSIILSSPAVKLVKERFPSSEIYFLTFAQNKSVLQILSLIDEDNIITISHDSLVRFIPNLWRMLWRIRKERFTVVIDLEFFSRFTAILSYLSGTPCRVGYYNYHVEGLYRGNFLTHKVYYNSYKHTAESYIHLVSILGIKELPRPILPSVHLDEGRTRVLREKLRMENPAVQARSALVIFNVNSSKLASDLRQWGPNNFSALADCIIQKSPDAFVVFIGSAGEAAYTEGVRQMMRDPDRAINLAGKTDISELLTLFSIARVFVSCDSGPMHLASLTKVPIIGIFGPETPLLYAPLSERCDILYKGNMLNCSPCMTVYNGKRSSCSRSRVNYKECMKLIPVDEVCSKVVPYLI